jgi:endonuclease V-like protein UPF0215 family
MLPKRPHIFGIDDAPFSKEQTHNVPIVGVMMEGATLVEGVAVTSFPVDGENATGFLAAWIRNLRFYEATQGIVLGGITLAGLGVVNILELSEHIERPVFAVGRRDTADSELAHALRTAGLKSRLSILAATPATQPIQDGLHLALAGSSWKEGEHLVRATLNKANIPEPLRVAHLIGAALEKGASRGRV